MSSPEETFRKLKRQPFEEISFEMLELARVLSIEESNRRGDTTQSIYFRELPEFVAELESRGWTYDEFADEYIRHYFSDNEPGVPRQPHPK